MLFTTKRAIVIRWCMLPIALIATLVIVQHGSTGEEYILDFTHPELRPFPLLDRSWSTTVTASDPCRMDQVTHISYVKELLAQRVVLDGNVPNMLLVAQTLGSKELFEALPHQHWHAAGQAIASLSCFQRNITAGLKLFDQLFYAAINTNIRVNGLNKAQHGAIWWLVANYNSSWSFILSELCPSVAMMHDCMHPAGHGFVIKHATHSYGPASLLPPLRDVSALARALAECQQGSFADSNNCATGVFHATMEAGDFSFPESTMSWAAPCNELDLPVMCFFYLFLNGLGHEWRRSSLSSYTSQLTDICSDQDLRSEVHVRACISGLGANGFQPYVRTLLLVRQHARFGNSENHAQELCEHQAHSSFVEVGPPFKTADGESLICRLIFGDGRRIFVGPETKPSVYDWCSLVTPLPEDSTGHLYYRWLSCVTGSLGYPQTVGGFSLALASTESRWLKLCEIIWSSMASTKSSKPTTTHFGDMTKAMASVSLSKGWDDLNGVIHFKLAKDFCRPVPSHLNRSHVMDVCLTAISWMETFPAYMEVIYHSE